MACAGANTNFAAIDTKLELMRVSRYSQPGRPIKLDGASCWAQTAVAEFLRTLRPFDAFAVSFVGFPGGERTAGRGIGTQFSCCCKEVNTTSAATRVIPTYSSDLQTTDVHQ
jgi:hypothetical protein